MPLPTIATPSYTLEIPSIKKEIKFRPFLVKEEKILIIAMESEDSKQIADAVKTVISNCILTKGIKVDQLATFDIEYLFLNIRARSVSEIINLNYKCNNDVKNKEDDDTHKCGHTVKIDVNILDVKPKTDAKQETKIQITDKVGMVMKYPNFDTLKKYENVNQADVIMKLTSDCIDYIYDDDQIFYAKDTPEEELIEFIEGMQSKDLEKIKNFFDNMPKISKDLDFKCGKCGHEEKIIVEGLESFFV